MANDGKTNITTLAELADEIEARKEQKRERIGKTRTKQESHEIKGEMLGLDEALYLVKQLMKNTE